MLDLSSLNVWHKRVRGCVNPFLSDPFAHMTLKNRVHEGENKGIGARWELAKDELATQEQQDGYKG